VQLLLKNKAAVAAQEALERRPVAVKAKRAKANKRRKQRRRRGRARGSKRARLRTGTFAKRMQSGRLMRDDGDIEGAVRSFSAAIALQVSATERSIALSERGEAHFSAGDEAAAISDLRAAIQIDGLNSFALKTLGFIEYQRFKQGDASARGRAAKLLTDFRAVSTRPDAAVERWLAELE
jgi:tetratricopeptide (TPR) repeat protein